MQVVCTVTHPLFSLTAKTDADQMKLFIDAVPSGTAAVSAQDLFDALHAKFPGVSLHEGVVRDIATILSRGESALDRRVAKGREPVTGRDGKLLLLVKPFTGAGELRAGAGAATDLADLHLFDNVTKGQVVGRVYPPRAGVPGVSALGAVLPAKDGTPYVPRLHSSLLMRQAEGAEYKELVAQRDGFVIEENGALAVQDEWEVRDDLDRRFGHVRFIGKLKIRGSVTPGLNINAVKGVEIHGAVQGGTVSSSHGDIVLTGYTFGGPTGRVIGGRNAEFRVAHEVYCEALGDVRVQKEALGCEFHVGASLVAPRAVIVGGRYFVVCGVEALELGNEAGMTTKVHLCSDVESRAEYQQVQRDLAQLEQVERLITLYVGPYLHDRGRLQRLGTSQRDKIERLLQKLHTIESALARTRAKREGLLASARENPTLRVSFHRMLYPGVELHARDQVFTTKEPIVGPCSIEFDVAENQFVITKFAALECSFSLPEEKHDGKKS